MHQIILAAIVVLAVSTPAAAQWNAVEVGAGISRGCTGDSSGFCDDLEIGLMWALHASAWIDDRVEMSVRLATLPLRDWNYSVPRDSRFSIVGDPALRELSRIDVTVVERSRRILSGEAIYHFARGRPVRGFLGGGLGRLSNRFVQSCTPAGCERLMPILSSPVGQHVRHIGNMTIVGGVSGRITRKVYVRGGMRLHNFGGEGLSTSEIFIAMAYRFGR